MMDWHGLKIDADAPPDYPIEHTPFWTAVDYLVTSIAIFMVVGLVGAFVLRLFV